MITLFQGINNCVGFRNQKYFILFILYIFLSSCYVFFLVSWRLYHCISEGTASCRMKQPILEFLHSGLLLFESLVFAVFVFVMGLDQYYAIKSNQTGIQKLKGIEPAQSEREGFISRLLIILGGPSFHWTHLLPLSESWKSQNIKKM